MADIFTFRARFQALQAALEHFRYVWLAEGTDTKVGAALDPEGRMLAEGQGLYEQLLTDIGTAVADCLAGK